MLNRLLGLNSLLRKKAFVARITKAVARQIYGRHSLALIARTQNGLFAVDVEDFGVGRELIIEGSYSQAELAQLERHIGPSSQVLFVGAHIGSLVVPVARRCRKVVAIEANPHTFELLEINLSLNKIGNCQALNIAANDKEGPLEFLLNRANSGGSKRVPATKHYMYYYDKPQTVSVDGFRLDDRVAERDFDLIVMDIEGSEYFALQGMQEILRSSKVLAVEFLPHHLRNVSRASVADFVSLIEPHFSLMTIPSKGLQVTRSGAGFTSALQQMYDADQGDNGIVFEKQVSS